ncbi:uncharacterized protein LOC119194023 isoform X4 [Pungitius pungitius]|uniref:uncharacterized protein LOC119194023 isoform X4 n=1 Tax=Pungitius pungitius TaxID=134920 RepID=UPI002E161E81
MALGFIMAGRLLSVILVYSCANIQTQVIDPPKLIMSSAVITETGTVTLECRAPSSPPVNHCYFIFVSVKHPKGFTCLQTLTGTELLKMSHQGAPAEVKVQCFYTVMFGDVNKPSPHSITSSITIQKVVESITTQTEPTPTRTTAGLRASTPETPQEQTSDRTFGPSHPGSFSSPPPTPEEPTPATQIWKWMIVSCLGGFFLLVPTLLCTRRTSEICSYKRSQADATGSEDLEEQTPTSEKQAEYHLYSFISEEPPAPAQEDMVYSSLQPH